MPKKLTVIEWDVPLHSYHVKDKNIPHRIYLLGGVKVPGAVPSLQMKSKTWSILHQHGLNNSILEDQLHYLIIYPKYKDLAKKFMSASSSQQIEIYYHFVHLLHRDWTQIYEWKQNQLARKRSRGKITHWFKPISLNKHNGDDK